MTVAFLAALALYVGLTAGLARRQRAHVLRYREAVPPAFSGLVSPEDHRKAADYAAARATRQIWSAAAWALFLIVMTLLGGLDLLDRWFGPRPIPLLLAAFFLQGAYSFVAAWLHVFGIETRFGFNRTTRKTFLLDAAKSALVGLGIFFGLVPATLALMAGAGPFWWLWVWGVWLLFTLFLQWIYPTLLAPLFHEFTPLPEGELSRRIRSLLERTGFPARGLYTMDGSRRSTRANAYFTGFGRHKRIVLFDTLERQLSAAEIEAVLAHELGHFRHRDVAKGMLLGAASNLAGLALLGWLRTRGWFYEGLGVDRPGDAFALLLFLWVGPLFAFPLRPIASWWSRRNEFAADGFAAREADPAAMRSALIRLHLNNASTLTPDPLYAAFWYSHPPAAERLAHLGAPIE